LLSIAIPHTFTPTLKPTLKRVFHYIQKETFCKKTFELLCSLSAKVRECDN